MEQLQPDSKVELVDLTQAVVLDAASQWANDVLDALRGQVMSLTTMQATDLHRLVADSPINVSFDRVNCNAFRKRQTALLLSTERHFNRCLWVVYDKLKRDDSEIWDEYIVVMYSNRVSEEDEDIPQEGILSRYWIPEPKMREVWIRGIASSILMNLYREHKYEALRN